MKRCPFKIHNIITFTLILIIFLWKELLAHPKFDNFLISSKYSVNLIWYTVLSKILEFDRLWAWSCTPFLAWPLHLLPTPLNASFKTRTSKLKDLIPSCQSRTPEAIHSYVNRTNRVKKRVNSHKGCYEAICYNFKQASPCKMNLDL